MALNLGGGGGYSVLEVLAAVERVSGRRFHGVQPILGRAIRPNSSPAPRWLAVSLAGAPRTISTRLSPPLSRGA